MRWAACLVMLLGLSCSAPGEGPATARSRAALLSPERPLDAPVPAPTLAGEFGVTLSWDGTQYVAAWIDAAPPMSEFTLRTARVSTAGAVLDVPAVVVAPINFFQWPVIGFDCTSMSGQGQSLVPWTSTSESRLYVTRVSSQGQLLGNIPVATSSDYVVGPAVATAANSSGWLFAWVDQFTQAVQAVRVSPAGVVLDAPPLALGSSEGVNNFGQVVSIAASERVYLAAWMPRNGAQHDIVAARIAVDGGVLDPGGLTLAATAADEVAPRVAWNGTHFVVFWAEGGLYGGPFRARRVSEDGTLDPTVTLVADAGLALPYTDWFTGAADTFLASWTTAFDDAGYSVFAQQFDDAAAPLGPPFRVGSTTSFNVPSSSSIRQPGGALVAWTTTGGVSLDVLAARVSSSGQVLDDPPLILSLEPNQQMLPSLAPGSGEYLATWYDTRGFGTAVAAVSPGGSVLGSVNVLGAGDRAAPSAAWNGTDYFVVWQRTEPSPSFAIRVLGQRVSATAAPLGAAAQLTFTDDGFQPAVASDGVGWVAIWVHDGGYSTSYDIEGVALDSAGARVSSAPFPISPGAAGSPVIAWDGQQYVAAWDDQRDAGESIWAARLLPDAGTLGIAVFDARRSQRHPAIAGGSGQSLIAWIDGSDGGLALATRISAAGAVLDPAPLVLGVAWASPFAWSSNPKVSAAWAQDHYVVVWSSDGGMFASAVTPQGAVSAVEDVGPGFNPVVSALTPDAGLFVFTSASTQRLAVRVDGAGPDGTSCATNGDCASMSCVMQICCATACAGPCTGGTCAAVDAGGVGGGSGGGGGGGAAGGAAGGGNGNGGAGGGNGGGTDPSTSPGSHSLHAGCGCASPPGFVVLLILLPRKARRGATASRDRAS